MQILNYPFSTSIVHNPDENWDVNEIWESFFQLNVFKLKELFSIDYEGFPYSWDKTGRVSFDLILKWVPDTVDSFY